MAKRSRDLPIPEPAVVDQEAMELARVWMTGGTQVVSLRVGVPDPAAWGYTLADLAHHVAAAYQQKSGLDPRATMAAIREAFLDETSHDDGGGAAVDAPTGKVQLRVEHVTSATGVIEGRALSPRSGRTPKPRRSSSRAPTKLR